MQFFILAQLWNTEFSILIFILILISAIAPFVITHSRAQAISYSHNIDNMHDELAIKNPKDTFNFEAYTKPLRLWSWIFIGIFCIVCLQPKCVGYNSFHLPIMINHNNKLPFIRPLV